MPMPIFSPNTYTDLAKKFYKSANCTSMFYNQKNEIKCKNELDVVVCCETKIQEIYNKSYKIDTCYNENNSSFQFICNEEHFKTFLVDLLVTFLIILLILIILVIIKNMDMCCDNKSNEKKEKRSNSFRERLLINNTNNPLYGT